MSRIMNYASDLDVLVMQHPEDHELSKGRCISEGEVSTRLGLQGIPYIAEKIIIEKRFIIIGRISHVDIIYLNCHPQNL